MPARQVIVDGSNLATEGRSLPSLAQLDLAVREFLAENSDAQVTVVVDASFGHRIDPSELPMFEEAEAAGEVVSPPAGAIGRGDAFLLRIAEKTGATVLSNDSFQEFHGEHPWLFDDGRLIGGKPVPGVGWIFMPRAPVRGQKSREVVKEAKRKKRVEEAANVAPAAASGLDLAATRGKGRGKKVDRAIARATEEAVEPKSNGRRRRRGGAPPAEPVNEPLAFITFIAAHPLGSEVAGTVTEFSSHGAFVDADGARCYLPLSAMGDPPPRRAREVLSKGDERNFVVQALDPQRRGVELALPGFAHVAGGPTEETVEAEIHEKAATPKRRRREKTPTPAAPGAATAPVAPAAGVTNGKAAPTAEASVKKASATKKAGAKKSAGAKKTGAAQAATTKKANAGGVEETLRAKEAVQPDEARSPARTAEPAAPAKAASRSVTAAAAKPGAVAKKGTARAGKAAATTARAGKAAPTAAGASKAAPTTATAGKAAATAGAKKSATRAASAAKKSPAGAPAGPQVPSSAGPVDTPSGATPVMERAAPAQKAPRRKSANPPRTAATSAGSPAPDRLAAAAEPASTPTTPGPSGRTRRKDTSSTVAATAEGRVGASPEGAGQTPGGPVKAGVQTAGSEKRAPARTKKSTGPRTTPG